MSQPDFLYELFEDFMDDPANQDFSMDNGLVCRWMTGQAKISPKISAYYSKPYCTLPLKEIEDTNALLQLASAFYSEADTYRATVERSSKLFILILLPWNWQQNFWKMESQLQTSY